MFDLDIKGKGFNSALQNLANYDQIATQENRKAMNKSVQLVGRLAKKEAPVGAVGELRAKIHGEVRHAGPGQVVGVVGSYAPHGQVVEEGADPFWPNIAGLALWVLRKLRVNRKQLQSVTYLVARAISRSGLKAQPYLETGFKEAKEKIQGYFETALEKIVRRLT